MRLKGTYYFSFLCDIDCNMFCEYQSIITNMMHKASVFVIANHLHPLLIIMAGACLSGVIYGAPL
jgi:hypothetical protein